MILREKEKLHGAAVLRLLKDLSREFPEARFSLDEGISQSSYVLKGRLLREKRHLLLGIKQTPVEFSAGLFIKTSAKRKSPWRYNFKKEHQDEVRELFNSHGEVFNIFVNEMSGIACLNFEQLKEILDDNHEEQEWVAISQKLNESYRVSGNDGKLERPLAANSFPQVIVDHFESLLSTNNV